MNKIKLLLVVGLFLLPRSMSAVDVWLPDTSGFETGQAVQIPIYTADVTGLNVFSFYTRVYYDESVVSCTGATKTGTLSSSWGNPTVNLGNPGEVTVAMYGIQPLEGSGVMILLDFDINGVEGQSTPLEFSFFMFNEGNPQAETTDGSLFLGDMIFDPILHIDPAELDFDSTLTALSVFITNVGCSH